MYDIFLFSFLPFSAPFAEPAICSCTSFFLFFFFVFSCHCFLFCSSSFPCFQSFPSFFSSLPHYLHFRRTNSQHCVFFSLYTVSFLSFFLFFAFLFYFLYFFFSSSRLSVFIHYHGIRPSFFFFLFLRLFNIHVRLICLYPSSTYPYLSIHNSTRLTFVCPIFTIPPLSLLPFHCLRLSCPPYMISSQYISHSLPFLLFSSPA